MMYIMCKQAISDIEVITGVDIRRIDAMATKRLGKTVYFNIKPTEAEITDSEATDILGKLKTIPGTTKLLKSDKTIIENNLGKVYYRNVKGLWKRSKCKKLSRDYSKFTEDKDLTELQWKEIKEQEEIESIKALNAAGKNKAMRQELKGAMRASIAMRNELEIEGDIDPLGKSKTFYNEQKAIIEAKYKVV